MKKVIVFALGIILATSCQKQELVNNEKTSEAILLQKIKEKTECYVGNYPSSNRFPWGDVLKADLFGAIGGGGVGAWIGHFIPNGNGGTYVDIGGAVGAVMGGAAASIIAAMPLTIPPQDNWEENVIPNGNNPYDYVGYYHYVIVDSALDSIGEVSTLGVFDYEKYYNFSYDLLVNQGYPNASVSILSYTDIQDIILAKDFDQSVSYNIYHDEYLTFTEKQILEMYFATMKELPREQFVDYSIQVETIVNLSVLSVRSKAVLLSIMATARYGTGYWA